MIPEKSDDAILADTLRRQDPEQFYTLVRMHLSFVLDLNTDECDGGAEKSKFRPLKWSFPSFAKRNKVPLKEPAETTPLTPEAAARIFKLIEWLSEEKNVTQEGIFRRSGKMTRQQELRNLLNSRETLVLDDGRFSVHDGASVLKNVLAQLPEPLLTEAHYPAHCQIAELCSNSAAKMSDGEEERLLKALQLILHLLPTDNLALLRDLMKLLHLTASHVALNKMSADNLATLFTPHLLCPRRLTPEALHMNSQLMAPVLSFMIVQGPTLFEIPTQLATDIRAYWTARQEKDLNESVCDSMAAKTVFTFVDRERTAEASATANPTEAALAQLYAHIQSLPESSKKKKLIKQFNKENGQGTPQLQEKGERMSRTRHMYSGSGARPRARSRSLGDSIKKHMPVFNKAPKRRKDSSEQSQPKSPYSGSPLSKVKVFDKSANDGNSSPMETSLTDSSAMPPLKKSLFKSKSNGSEPNLMRVRLSANAKRTPLSVLTQNTMTPGEADTSRSSPKPRTPSSSSGSLSTEHTDESTSSRTSPEPLPFPVPNPPDLGAVPLKQLPGSDENCPVSTAAATASASSSPAGLTNSLLLTTPRNMVPWTTSTPACNRAACPLDASSHNSLLTPSNTTGNNSMSPITRSTQKMPKAMQENMMTPRSRKPVVALSSSNLCQLAHLSAWGPSGTGELLRNATNRATLLSERNSTNLTRKLAMMHEESYAELLLAERTMLSEDLPAPSRLDKVEEKATSPDRNEPHYCTGVQHEPDADTEHNGTCKCGNACDKPTGVSLEYFSCGSADGECASITGTFRDYLMSRSVLTASPVDLSFSSRTGDFDTSSDREMKMILSGDNMTDSLLYCLDGNEPGNIQRSFGKAREILGKTPNGDGELKESHTRGESESSGVEADDDCYLSGSNSLCHSLNRGHDSISTGSLSDKSPEKPSAVMADVVPSAKETLPGCTNNGVVFPRSVAKDDIMCDIGLGGADGCLVNISASLV